MYSLKQLVISGRKRRWILMDLETSLPLLYPLRYHIDHLAFRSLSTQSASLQSVKFFYEFWRQKYGVSFCYSFYSSDHNPDIAVGEMPAFWMYLENGHNVQSNVLSLTRVTKANSLTHTVRVRAVIHFISFLINTYISPAYRDDSPKALSLLASRLHTRLQLCRENYRTLTSNKFSQHSHSSQGFQSLSGAMVLSLYGIITPSSAQKHNPLNPFPSGHLQFRNFLIIRLLLNYGLRTGELLLLECSSIKPNRQIDDPAICKRFQDKGLPDYFLGIRYVGVKGAGERTHWVEPLAVPLVESIFSTVKMLTAPIRSHLTYLRAKSFADYLPQAISNMPGERVELDDVVKYITQTTSSFRGRAGQRDKTSKALSKRGVLPVQEIPGPKNSKSIYYSKTALNHYIKTEFGLANANEPCTHAWMENGKRYQVNYEDLLFLHEKGSLALKRTLALLATPIPFTNTLMNKFLGNVEPDGSVFSKYQLLEEDGTSTRMRTHIPRHNINTFLAIADISDHLQAMLMGRVDITQNQHYQHLALAERRKAASLVPLQPISTALTVSPSSSSIATPLDIVKRTGQLAVTEHMTLDNTIKANLHTFDDRDDVARFVEASFANGLFEDVAAAFEEIRDAEGPEQASDMVARHAVLYPLKFGSCMREVNLWGCPYRLKCQSAAFCEHFTLTGRIDELPNLIAKKQALQQAHSKLTQLTQHQPDYQTRLADIERRLQQLEAIQAQWHRRAKTQQLVAAESVLSGGVITEGKVRTLAQLFALEYQQLMQEND